MCVGCVYYLKFDAELDGVSFSFCSWDNRITIHTVSYDYEGKGERHGTRVSSLAEKPFFDPGSKSRREALGLDA
jgi:hypothetical protein